MGFGLRPPWHVIPYVRRMVGPSFARLRNVGEALWHQPRARYRLLIVVAAVFVSIYAFSVLAYVLATPEIGVRCVFSRTVNHFYNEFLDPPDQAPVREGEHNRRRCRPSGEGLVAIHAKADAPTRQPGQIRR